MPMLNRIVQEKRILPLLILLLITAPALGAEAELELSITDVRSDQGHVLVALHRYHEGATWQDEPCHVAEIAALDRKDNTLHYHFTGLVSGHYAIRLFHDLNDNQVIDRNRAGVPLEPFAFSLAEDAGAVVLPMLEQALLDVSPGRNVVELELRHPQTR